MGDRAASLFADARGTADLNPDRGAGKSDGAVSMDATNPERARGKAGSAAHVSDGMGLADPLGNKTRARITFQADRLKRIGL